MSKGSRRKAQKQFQREQEQRSKQINSIKSLQKINPITAGWMFNRWFEKVILIGLMSMGIWKTLEIFLL